MSDLSRVEDLAQRVADGLADEAEFAELEGLMEEDRESRILYLKTQQLHQDLERKSARGTLGSERTGENEPIEFPVVSSRLLGPVLAVAASLIAAIAVWMWLADQGEVDEVADPHVAIISRLDRINEPFEYNQPFEPGDRIAINSGFMELTYRNSVRLVLQGPVDYTLVDADRGRLELGSLAAEVPPEVSGFTVVTPSAEVKDIGTRFAVALLDTGRTELEVFEGKVQAKSAMTGSVFKSFKTGETAAIDDGQTEVQSIPTTAIRFRAIENALNRRTVKAVADRFVQGGRHADVVPTDGPDILLLKQLGANNEVARKVWLRFDLSEQPVNLLRPATLTLHTAKDIKRESWDIHLHGLMSGFKPANGIQGIDWREETLTWNNAPGNDVGAPVKMDGETALITSGKIRVDPITEPAGSYFTFIIPSLEPFMQEDGTLTLMLSVVSGRHTVLNLSAREHERFEGPLLTFETR